jgi:phosphoribosylformylglycinamidine synthase
VAVAESAFRGGVGAAVEGGWLAAAVRADVALFGEAQSRVIVSVASEDAAAFEKRADGSGVPCVRLGTVGGERLRIGPVDIGLQDAQAIWSAGLANALAGES